MRLNIFLPAIFVVMLLLLSIVAPQKVHAAEVEQNLQRTLTLKEDRVSVREELGTRITVSGKFLDVGSPILFRVFNPIVNDVKAQEKLNKTLPTIRLTDESGTPISFDTEIVGQDILVTASYPFQVRQTERKIILRYDSFSLSSKTGAIYDLYVPSFSEDFEFDSGNTSLKVNTRVVVDRSFGDFNFIIPEAAPRRLANGNRLIEFSQEDLTGVISWIQIGTTQYYEFDIVQEYAATSNVGFLSNEYDITLPRDVNAGPLQQRVFFTEINPEPIAVFADDDENLIARFRFPANQSGEINIRGYVETSEERSVDIRNSGSLDTIPADISTAATGSTQYWESDSPEILAVAKQLQGEERNVYKLVEKTYRYVVDLIDYSEVKRFGINERQGALKTLQGGAAVCMEYSDLFVALMRAQGVPARAAFGYGYDPRTTDGVDTAHQWAEVYIPSLDEWIMVDTTWGESGAAVIGSDLNHFYKYVASESPLSPSPVSVKFFGEIDQIEPEDFRIEAVASPPSGEDFISSSQLINKYALDDIQTSLLNQIFSSFINTAQSSNAYLDNFFTNQYGIENGFTLQLIRFIIYAVPLLLIVGIFSLGWSLIRPTKPDKPTLKVKQVGRPK